MNSCLRPPAAGSEATEFERQKVCGKQEDGSSLRQKNATGQWLKYVSAVLK